MRRLALHDRFDRRFGETDFELRLPGGSVFLAADTFTIDQATLHEVFRAHDYETDFANATVLDFGAHKGYFAAYALLAGAASVLSYEPEEQNFAYLQRAANSFPVADWRARRAAVGAEAGRAELRVSMDSWGHSLLTWPGEPEDIYEVDIVAAQRALQEASSMPGDRLIAKIDVEGAECGVICGTPTRDWACLDEMFVEHHIIAPCSVGEIAEHLAAAGLQPLGRLEPQTVLRFRRNAADPIP